MIWKAWRNESMPLLALLVAVVGLVTVHMTVLFIGLFFWGLTLLASHLARRTLQHMTVTSHVVQAYAEIGQPVGAEMVIQNPLPWPILDVQWKIDLPQSLTPSGVGTTLMLPGGARQTLTGTLWVAARQRVRVQYRLTGLARGRWQIGPGALVFRDPLSWNELVREDRTGHELTVWPRRVPLPESFWSASRLFGPQKGKPWDSPDPLRVVGVRPYQPGDSVRHVAPYASARLRELMVKQLEPVTERTVEILLHPKTTDAHWHGVDIDLLEDAITAAASVAESAVLEGLAVGLASTGAVPGHIRGFSVTPRDRQDAGDLLTALAWLQPSGTMDDDLEHVLVTIDKRLRSGTLLVIVSPYWLDEFTERLEAKVRRGLRVMFLTSGERQHRLPDWVREVWHFDQGRWTRE